MAARHKSGRGSSTSRADAFARSERQEKASARFGRNDTLERVAIVVDVDVVANENSRQDAGATDARFADKLRADFELG
jgi:hypothetical protein